MKTQPSSQIALTLSTAFLCVAGAAVTRAQPDDQVESVANGDVIVSVREVAKGLEEPWALAFLPDGRMLVTQHGGDLVVVTRDGSVSAPVGGTPEVWSNGQGGLMDVVLVGREGADLAIWSCGHRNIEAAAIDWGTVELWVAEMGPLGGDELNRIERGANYGWPVVSWGINYNGIDIPDPTEFPEYEDAVHHWSPVRSPSGMIVYDGAMFPEWRGDILFGALSAGGVERVDMEAGEVRETQFIPLNTRIREVAQGSDGAIWLLTNTQDGPESLWKLVPQEVRPASQDGGRTGPGAVNEEMPS